MLLLAGAFMLPYSYIYRNGGDLLCYGGYSLVLAILFFWAGRFLRKYRYNKNRAPSSGCRFCQGWVICNDTLFFDFRYWRASDCRGYGEEIEIVRRVGLLHPIYFIIFYLSAVSIICFFCCAS